MKITKNKTSAIKLLICLSLTAGASAAIAQADMGTSTMVYKASTSTPKAERILGGAMGTVGGATSPENKSDSMKTPGNAVAGDSQRSQALEATGSLTGVSAAQKADTKVPGEKGVGLHKVFDEKLDMNKASSEEGLLGKMDKEKQ